MTIVNKYILILAWDGLPDTPTTLQSKCVLPSLALCKLYRQGVGGHIKNVWADWSVWVRDIHLLLAAVCLSQEHWHWWEQTGWIQSIQSDASSLWLQSFWSSLLLSIHLSLSMSFCLISKIQNQMSDRRHGTWHTIFCPLSFSISLILPTHSHACMHTPTHSLLPLIPRSLTRHTMEELLLRHSVRKLQR